MKIMNIAIFGLLLSFQININAQADQRLDLADKVKSVVSPENIIVNIDPTKKIVADLDAQISCLGPCNYNVGTKYTVEVSIPVLIQTKTTDKSEVVIERAYIVDTISQTLVRNSHPDVDHEYEIYKVKQEAKANALKRFMSLEGEIQNKNTIAVELTKSWDIDGVPLVEIKPKSKSLWKKVIDRLDGVKVSHPKTI